MQPRRVARDPVVTAASAPRAPSCGAAAGPVGRRPGAESAREQRRERQRAHDLHANEQKRVVRGAGTSERRDVERTVDVPREALAGDLGHSNHHREGDDPFTAADPCSHRLSIILPGLRVADRPASARGMVIQSSADGGRCDGAVARAACAERRHDGRLDRRAPRRRARPLQRGRHPRRAGRGDRLKAEALLVVDLSDVDFLDSTALGVLIEARAKLGADRLALASPQHEVRRTLQVSGLDRQLPVYDTVDAALA